MAGLIGLSHNTNERHLKSLNKSIESHIPYLEFKATDCQPVPNRRGSFAASGTSTLHSETVGHALSSACYDTLPWGAIFILSKE